MFIYVSIYICIKLQKVTARDNYIEEGLEYMPDIDLVPDTTWLPEHH